MKDLIQDAARRIAALVNLTNASRVDPSTNGPDNFRWRIDDAEIILMGVAESPSSGLHVLYFDNGQPTSRISGYSGFPIDANPDVIATLIGGWLQGP
ncbi:MAG: hypothetical protein ABI282_08465 [Candidatus Baltobacteraceae bacterium]